MSELKSQIAEATIVAMKAREKERVATFRMVNAELKLFEVDERRDLLDDDVLRILKKMVKQRQDSLSQFKSAGRDDLANKEAFEIALIDEFLPAALSDGALTALVDQAIGATGAKGMGDMGKVMAALKQTGGSQVDMGKVSALVKERLSA